MGKAVVDNKKLDKKYLLLFVVFFMLELFLVYYPNVRAIYRLREERFGYEEQMEMPVLKRGRHRNKMSREEMVQRVDEMISTFGIEVLYRKLESVSEKKILLEYEMRSDEKAMYEFLSREEWKNSHRILNIKIEKQSSRTVSRVQIECAEFE